MSVTTTPSKQAYTGDGSKTTPFDFTFKVFEEGDVEVYVADVLQTITTHYTIVLSDNGDTGGTVTFVTAPANGAAILIKRKLELTQPRVLPIVGPLPSKTVEKAIDKNTMITQQLQEELDRTPKLAAGSTSNPPELPEPSDGKGLKWSSGNLINTDDDIDDTAANATAAAASASAASASASAAATSATNAAASAATVEFPTITVSDAYKTPRVNSTPDDWDLRYGLGTIQAVSTSPFTVTEAMLGQGIEVQGGHTLALGTKPAGWWCVVNNVSTADVTLTADTDFNNGGGGSITLYGKTQGIIMSRGGGNFTVPVMPTASTSIRGILYTSSIAEAQALTNTARIITPYSLGFSLGHKLLASATASGSASLDFSTLLDSTYDAYLVELVNILPATDGADLWLRAQVGGSYISGAGTYKYCVTNNDGAENADRSESETKIKVARSIDSDIALGGFNGSLKVTNPESTSHCTNFFGTGGNNYQSLNRTTFTQFFGQLIATSAVTGFQLLMSTGNIASGSAYLYGIRRT